ncbi:MAG TPA: glycoside hydrolase family 9 protein [Pyrinomonadaceae bacterium]|nr:glycoside hydrolase family 9 protein [Pyrinomonadaceae bacterium]
MKNYHPTRRSPRRAALACALLAAFAQVTHAAVGAGLRLNTVGYLPRHGKRATLPGPCGEFRVVRVSDGATVLRGRSGGPLRDDETGEALCVADFTALRAPGLYRLEASAGRAATFRVSADVYETTFKTAVRAMHLWRCGSAVSLEHDGVTYAHAACHLEDARLDFVGSPGARLDTTGGWHDAGDYNKYVVNAGVTVGLLLRAWEEFGARVRRVDLGLPESQTKLPAYLSEVKWELDWLLKMQAEDGSVYHKVSTRDFGPAVKPEDEKTERFVTPWSSAATADFVAVTAAAARAYRPFDAAYSRRLLDAARKSYRFLRAHPESRRADLKGFTTGGYQTDDADDRLWAAAELWQTTGDRQALADFEERARRFEGKFSQDWGWGDVKNLGMLTYLFSKRPGRDPRLVRRVREALTETADRIVAVRDRSPHARPLTRYYWGANGGVANTTPLLRAAHRIVPKPVYVETALDALSHLLGRNFYGRSLVTGVGFEPPRAPHDRRSMAPGSAGAWPGYLVGGGWPRATDWVDDADNYRVNEIAINWNAPLVYALASTLPETPSRR